MKITPINEKTWQDKKFWEVTTEHEGVTVNASIWPPFPVPLVLGQEVEIAGTMTKNSKGYWTIKTNPMGAKPAWAKKEGAIDKAMEKKEASIGRFQDNKEYSIKVASTMNKAVELAIAESKNPNFTELESNILKWRKWLWSNWNVDETEMENPF